MRFYISIYIYVFCTPARQDLGNYGLSADTSSLLRIGPRIMRCAFEYFLESKHLTKASLCLSLSRCLFHKMWEESALQIKQLPMITQNVAYALRKSGVKNLEDLRRTDPRFIETTTGKKFPFGNQVHEHLAKLPQRPDIQIEHLRTKKLLISERTTWRDDYKVTVTVANDASVPRSRIDRQRGSFVLFIGDEDSDEILYTLKFNAFGVNNPIEVGSEREPLLPLSSPLCPYGYLHAYYHFSRLSTHSTRSPTFTSPCRISGGPPKWPARSCLRSGSAWTRLSTAFATSTCL